MQPDGVDGDHLSFIECYYDDDENVVGWCAHDLAGESLYDLHGQLQRLLFVVAEAITLERAATNKGPRGLVSVYDLPTADTPDEVAERFGDDEVEPVSYPQVDDA